MATDSEARKSGCLVDHSSHAPNYTVTATQLSTPPVFSLHFILRLATAGTIPYGGLERSHQPLHHRPLDSLYSFSTLLLITSNISRTSRTGPESTRQQ